MTSELPQGDLILYRTDDGQIALQLRAVGGTVWLTQAEIATVFDTTVQNVNLHLKNIFADNELAPDSVIKESLITAADGKNYRTRLHNLDAILAVGYRVRGPRGAQFRRWATTILREYLIKGFVLNDEYLKDPTRTDYFAELLRRIRDIRASEKRFYQQVRDVFKATSADYDSSAETARSFFATIQNKLVYAVTGQTAAELIVARADPAAPDLGLTSWTGSRVRQTDATISKNYLTGEEIESLNRLTTMFLDFAEDRAQRRQQTRMVDWIAQTDRFLAFNERDVLRNAGRVSHDRMQAIIRQRFEKFDISRRKAEAIEAAREEEIDFAQLHEEAQRLRQSRKSE